MNNQQVVASFHTAHQIIRHFRGQLTGDELNELHRWINGSEANFELFEQLQSAGATSEAMQSLRSYAAGDALVRFLRKLHHP